MARNPTRGVFATVVVFGLMGCGGGGGSHSGGGGGGGGSGDESVGNDPNDVHLLEVEIHPGSPDAPEAPPGPSLSSAMRNSLDGRQADILNCYSGILPTHPDAAGRLTINLTMNNDGGVGRVEFENGGTGGLDSAQSCIENVVKEIHLSDVHTSRSQHVSRAYVFSNPPGEFTSGAAISVAAPAVAAAPAGGGRHGRRGRHGHGAAAEQPAAQPAATTPASGSTTAGSTPEGTPPPTTSGSGPLREIDVTVMLNQHVADLQTCYGNVLTSSRRAAGTVQLDMVVSGDGSVRSSSLANATGPFAGIGDCVSHVVQPIHFRAGGTQMTVHQPIEFHR